MKISMDTWIPNYNYAYSNSKKPEKNKHSPPQINYKSFIFINFWFLYIHALKTLDQSPVIFLIYLVPKATTNQAKFLQNYFYPNQYKKNTSHYFLQN